MVDANTLYTTFVQCCNSCTLASYAVASYHFTKLNVYNFFEDYCKHFKLAASKGQAAERAYDQHFQNRWQTLKCSGYEIIEDLHNNSQESVFVKSRAKFGVKFVSQTVPCLSLIETMLKNGGALVSVAFAVNSGVHSCCIGFDKRGFYMIETRPVNYTTRIIPIQDIQSLGSLRDSLLMFPLLQASKK
jgi:hypothetical protein